MPENPFDPFEGGVTRECLNTIFLLDTSGSMYGERITQLNTVMPDLFALMSDEARKQEIELTVRVINFNSDAAWCMGDAANGVAIADCAAAWQDLDVAGSTNTAAAIELARTAMHTEYLGTRTFHPLVFLITDGGSNSAAETLAATKRLKSSLVSTTDVTKEKINCISIGVIDANMSELEQFASTGTIVSEDEGEKENVPLVFSAATVDEMKSLFEGVILSSITSATDQNGGDGGLFVDPGKEEDDGGWGTV